MQTTLKVIMLGSLLLMLGLMVLPAFFTKPRHNANLIRNLLVFDTANKDTQQRYLAYAESLVKTHAATAGEVVMLVHDKGITLFDANDLQPRLAVLMQKGVEVYICDKSLVSATKQVSLPPQIKHVENGTAFAEQLLNSGYVDQFA